MCGYLGGHDVELVSMTRLTLQANAIRAVNVFGDGAKAAAAANGSRYMTIGTRAPTAESTVMWVGSHAATGGADATFAGIAYNSANGSPYVVSELKWTSGGTAITFTFNNTSSFQYCSSSSATAGAHVYIGRFKSGVQELWDNGVRVATTSLTGVHAVTSTSRFEVNDSLNSRDPGSTTNLATVWPRYISDDEVRKLSANPWLVLAPDEMSIWAGAAAAPGGTTSPYYAYNQMMAA